MTTFAPSDAPIALLRWPADADRRDLAAGHRPRLLLLEPDADPPMTWDVLEDWVRPADLSRSKRIATLMRRLPSARPDLLDGDGVLRAGVMGRPASHRSPTCHGPAGPTRRRGAWTCCRRGWPAGQPAGSSNGQTSTAASLLRRRLAEVGLEIHTAAASVSC